MAETIEQWRRRMADSIIDATWRHFGNKIDVTEKVKDAVASGNYLTANTLWLGDPLLEKPKILEIRWREGETLRTEVTKEDHPLPSELFNRPKLPDFHLPDSSGLVLNPLDETAYIPVSKIIAHFPDRAKDIKALTKILARHPSIRRWRPSPNRLSIHLGDWFAYLDGPAEKQDAEDDPVEIEQRKQSIRNPRK